VSRREPVPLLNQELAMGTDDLQELPAKEQTDIPGLLIAPGILVAVLAIIYTWT
jgi:hypothetical protein